MDYAEENLKFSTSSMILNADLSAYEMIFFPHMPMLLCVVFFFPQLSENLEQWPHLNELVQCYKADWVKDESKYGHYESITSMPFQSQIFECPDTDIETG